MKKVGVLGGTFNPPHIGHLIVANEVKHALGLDEVRLMPTAIPPHKNAPGDATADQRLRMVNLAIKDIEGLIASAFEVGRGGISYTFDTMEQLTKKEPNAEFYFIIGGDNIDILSKWYRIEELVTIVKFVGIGRPGSVGETNIPIIMVNTPQIELSSTLIRQRFTVNGTVQFLIPPSVELFIREEGLYGSCPAEENNL